MAPELCHPVTDTIASSHLPLTRLTDEERLLFFGPLMCGDGKTYPSTEAMKNGMRMFNESARAIAAHGRE